MAHTNTPPRRTFAVTIRPSIRWAPVRFNVRVLDTGTVNDQERAIRRARQTARERQSFGTVSGKFGNQYETLQVVSCEEITRSNERA